MCRCRLTPAIALCIHVVTSKRRSAKVVHSKIVPAASETEMSDLTMLAARRLCKANKAQMLLAAAAVVLMCGFVFQINVLPVESQKKKGDDESVIEVVPAVLEVVAKDRDRKDMVSSSTAAPFPTSTSTAATSNASTVPKDGIGANGAWWLDTKAPEYGHAFDVALCQALEDLFDGREVLDLGTGLGHYGRCFLRKREPMFPDNPGIDQQFYDGINRLNQSKWWNTTNQRVKSWTGYDGSPNVEQVTKGFVKHMDLTKDQDFKGQTWDWVMSMEVGEHIPAQFEDSFISNIIKPVKDNLVLSWAVRGQGGRSHINELNNTEVVERLSRRGFTMDPEKSKTLRSKATAYWFKNSLMVFMKNRS